MHLADINLWLALVFEAHVHHRRAARWFEGRPAQTCAMCRVAQSGFLRLATNPAAFGEEAVTMSEAWGLYDALMSDGRAGFAQEPRELESGWRGYTEGQDRSPKAWMDAYLAAFARAAGMGLVSFDEGLHRYDGVRLTVPG